MKYTLNTPTGPVTVRSLSTAHASAVLLPHDPSAPRSGEFSECVGAAWTVEPADTTTARELLAWLRGGAEEGRISPCVILGVRIDATRASEDLAPLVMQAKDALGLAAIPASDEPPALVVIGQGWRYMLAALVPRRAEPRWEDRAATAEVCL